MIVADGRNHVELTDRRYDIIVTDPPPPIESSGASVISSLEYYQAGHARLNPGGVMMQWMPYGGTVDEFRAHVRTFHAVFPHVIDRLRPGRLRLLHARIRRADGVRPTSAIAEVLGRPGILEEISSAYDSPERTVDGWTRADPGARLARRTTRSAAFAGDGPLITDDRPLPEYFLLRRLFGTPSPKVTPSELLRLTGR